MEGNPPGLTANPIKLLERDPSKLSPLDTTLKSSNQWKDQHSEAQTENTNQFQDLESQTGHKIKNSGLSDNRKASLLLKMNTKEITLDLNHSRQVNTLQQKTHGPFW